LRRNIRLCAAAVLAITGCGGGGDGGTAKKDTPTAKKETATGKKDTPTFARVKKLALKEIGKCPKEKVSEYLSREGRQQRGIAESPMLFCGDLPAVWYVRYKSEDGYQKDVGRNRETTIPFFINANVLVTATLTAGGQVARTLPPKIKEDCGCGEVREPTRP
jgi:hypothetical protein